MVAHALRRPSTMSDVHQFAAHSFKSLDSAHFSPLEYSKLKFGCERVARLYGTDLAQAFFNTHKEQLKTNPIVVHSSPYNVVPNAATLMTAHFLNTLNELTVQEYGFHVDYSTVHRTVSYRHDYSKLSKADRLKMISGDSYYVNTDFIGNKTIVFIDDIHITGTHEVRIMDVLKQKQINNPVWFLCFARYTGNKPSIESELNLAGINSLESYVHHVNQEPYHANTRAIKYVLGQPRIMLKRFLPEIPDYLFEKMYYGALAEGYYKISQYEKSFKVLVDEKNRRK